MLMIRPSASAAQTSQALSWAEKRYMRSVSRTRVSSAASAARSPSSRAFSASSAASLSPDEEDRRGTGSVDFFGRGLDPGVQRQRQRLGQAGGLQGIHHVAAVHFDGTQADAERLGDLLVGMAGEQAGQHLLFAGGE